ncbi:C2 family cysteine protease [Calothrix sp. 336/3]|uniref:C2 family cysteine protease n=1 Tax=Calothrix sp. 336/3 TaxID=1337936 RepID=UPI0004E364A6|nr:C2 family cysteine protease [Calothrix sp. 336/3]AKG22386.1 peptidase [Calothrix sp. 336/3]
MPSNISVNSFSKAKDLNIASLPVTITDWVGGRETNDYYKISFTNRSSFNVVIDKLSADADLQLLNSQGDVVVGSYNRNISTETINRKLDAGTYYIRVYQVGRTTAAYRLQMSLNEAPQSLQFSTDKITYSSGETVKLVNTNVFDRNGVKDLTRVDLWLKKEGNAWQNISDVTSFLINQSDNRQGTFSYDLQGLGAGKYQLWGIAYDKSGNGSNDVFSSFDVVGTQDWFDENILDGGIRQTARARFADKVIDRNDMIAILRSSKDNNAVDSTELTDLQTLLKNSSYLQIPEHVKVLTGKVLGSQVANQKYQGKQLGNLSIGSSDVQLENLISKWFLGGDRPTTTYKYQYASGSLFQNGIAYQDIKQGDLDNCYFLSSLAATAFRTPNTIKNMFIDNGDGTFTVRFWQNGQADYVTVDRYLPTSITGYFVYASKGSHYQNANNELWVALAEKAYAQLNESGWIYQDNTNSYNGIAEGYASDALMQITGLKSASNSLNLQNILSAFNSGQLISFATKSNVPSFMVAGHAYTLVGYNSSSQTFQLFNPWGVDNYTSKPGILQLKWSDMQAYLSYWEGTTNRVVST